MFVRILSLLFVLASMAQASVREFDGVDWQVQASKYKVELSWRQGDRVEASFVQEAGLPLRLEFYAPYALRKAEKAELYSVTAPMHKGDNKRLLDSSVGYTNGFYAYGSTLQFDRDINVLLNSMAGGNWGVLELSGDAGVQYQFELPAIDFIASLDEFNARRNSLPALNWDMARRFSVYFDSGEDVLSKAFQSQLKNLVEFVKYDGGVESITIDAHTDAVGKRLQNLTLSKQRAEYVERELVKAGLDQKLVVAVRYHGQRYPLPGASGALNRRVDISLVEKKTDEVENKTPVKKDLVKQEEQETKVEVKESEDTDSEKD